MDVLIFHFGICTPCMHDGSQQSSASMTTAEPDSRVVSVPPPQTVSIPADAQAIR